MACSWIIASLLILLSCQCSAGPTLKDSAHAIQARQTQARLQGRDDYLNYCYGDNGICSLSSDLRKECDTILNSDKRVEWQLCMCGNGAAATDEECYWCQLAYQADALDSASIWSKNCQSVSATIAPVPTIIVSLYSHWNVTYTGAKPGTGTASSTQPVTGTTTSPSTRVPATTYYGGVTHLTTYFGGGEPTDMGDDSPSATGSSSSAAVTSGTDAAAGLDCAKVLMSCLAFCLGATILLM